MRNERGRGTSTGPARRWRRPHGASMRIVVETSAMHARGVQASSARRRADHRRRPAAGLSPVSAARGRYRCPQTSMRTRRFGASWRGTTWRMRGGAAGSERSSRASATCTQSEVLFRCAGRSVHRPCATSRPSASPTRRRRRRRLHARANVGDLAPAAGSRPTGMRRTTGAPRSRRAALGVYGRGG